MANTIVTEILAKDKTRAGLKSADKGVTGFAKRMSGLFKGLLGPVAALAGAAGIGLLTKKLFELGSSAVETRSRFESVFADQTGRVDDFIETFGKIAGVSKVNLQALTATSAAIAQGLGFAGEAATTLSIDITRLAGDLGSFNDIPTAETARAIQSALTGERESLKRLGIVIKQVQVDQLALVQTGKESTKELTEAERATATLALITEKAGVAVGDLARTQTSAANQARQIKAEFQNIADTIALGLLPAFEKLLPVLKDLAATISTALPGIAEFFITLRDAIAGDEVSDDIRATEESIRRLGFTAEQITSQRTAVLATLVNKQKELNDLVEEEANRSLFETGIATQERTEKIKLLTIAVAELSAVEETLLRLANERAAAEKVADTAATTRVTNAKAAALEQAEGGFGVTPGVIAGPDRGGPQLRDIGEAPVQREMITAVDDFGQGMFDALEPLRMFNEELGKTENLGRLVGEVMVGMTNQFVSTFASIGRGAGVFAAFAKGSKKAIGDVASAEGQKGIALGALKIGESLFPPNPVLLASGLLGIAKGGLLVALGAKLGGGGGGFGGGRGGAGGGGTIPRRDNTADGNRRGFGGPRGNVTLRLPPGNILDLNNPELFAAFTKAQKDAAERGGQVIFERV